MDGHRESVSNEGGDLNFAQRLLMANENAVTNIADLWVAAAMNVDNEDPFESDTEMYSDGDVDAESLDLGEPLQRTDSVEDDPFITASASPGQGRRGSSNTINAESGASPNPRFAIPHRHPATNPKATHLGSPRHPSSIQQSPNRHMSVSFHQPVDGTPTSRRFSTKEPGIFAHSGVKTPPAVLDAQQLLARSELDVPGISDSLAPIQESRRTSQVDEQLDIEALEEKAPSLASQLPVVIIVQYGLLALHTTTHDQIFMSYLVS